MVAFSEYKEIIKSWLENQDSLEIKAFRFKKILDYLYEIDSNNNIRLKITEINSKLSSDINNLILEIEATNSKIVEMESIISKNQSKLTNRDELNIKYETLLNIQKIIKELNIKKTEIDKPENAIDDLNDKILEINGAVDEKLNDYIMQLNALNNVLIDSKSQLEQETSEKIKQAFENIEIITNEQYCIIKKLSNEPVKSIYETFNERIINLTDEYNAYVDKIESIKNDLEIIENKHSNIVESFKQHKLENERIFGNLRKIGEPDGVNVYVENLIREINNKLSDFDDNIKKLIKKKKELPIYERI